MEEKLAEQAQDSIHGGSVGRRVVQHHLAGYGLVAAVLLGIVGVERSAQAQPVEQGGSRQQPPSLVRVDTPPGGHRISLAMQEGEQLVHDGSPVLPARTGPLGVAPAQVPEQRACERNQWVREQLAERDERIDKMKFDLAIHRLILFIMLGFWTGRMTERVMPRTAARRT